MPAVTVRDVDPQAFNKAFSEYLKYSGRIELPVWVDYIKTASHRELAPADEDWYYNRAASIARTLYVRDRAFTIDDLARYYNSLARNGHRPNHFKNGNPEVAEHICGELVKLDLLEAHPDGGFVVSEIGRRGIDAIAEQVYDAAHSAADEE